MQNYIKTSNLKNIETLTLNFIILYVLDFGTVSSEFWRLAQENPWSPCLRVRSSIIDPCEASPLKEGPWE